MDTPGAGPRALALAIGVLIALAALPAVASAQDYRFVRAFGGSGSAPGELNLPLGVTAAPDGTVYVADTFNHRIQAFDEDGTPLDVIGAEGSGPGRFNSPFDVEFDPDGNLLVADTGNRRIQRIDPASGEMLASFGAPGSGPDLLAAPTSVAPDGSGGAYVVDRDNQRLHRYAGDGTLIGTWGGAGAGQGQFSSPLDVTVGNEGVYVADAGNDRVQRLSADGEFVSEWGGLSTPQGLDRDPGGLIFVADSGNDRVRFFDPFGAPLGMWGLTGTGAGEFDFPRGIAADCAGRVFVSDVFNNRIQVFADVDAEPEPGACGLTIEALIEAARGLDLPGRSEQRIVRRLEFVAALLERGETDHACHSLGKISLWLHLFERHPHGSEETAALAADVERFMLDLGCAEQPRGAGEKIERVKRWAKRLLRAHR